MKISDHDMKEYEKLFAPVLEWLDVEVYKKNPKLGFNMYNYHDDLYAKDFRGKGCEETVCVLGYLWKHHGFNCALSYTRAKIVGVFNFEDDETALNVLYCISMVEENDDDSLVNDLSKINPYQVAAVIRYFLKTRKVKWGKFLTDDQKTKEINFDNHINL